MEAIQLAGGCQPDKGPARSQPAILPHYPLRLDWRDSPQRGETEAFIARRFKTVYGARVTHFMTCLLAAADDSDICAALGFAPATVQSPLFLEHYLDASIESVLAAAIGTSVDRTGVVEIGNLASTRQRATGMLFLLMSIILQRAGFQWVVFTANQSVRQWMMRLGLDTLTLAQADPDRLPDRGRSWGRYYEDRPVVLACNINRAFSRLQHHPLIDSLRQCYQPRIDELVRQLRP